MTTSISSRGYSIIKSEYPSNIINDLKKELTVKPFINQSYGGPTESFPIYGESLRKIYMPRYFGLKKFGKPKINKLKNGKTVNLDFSKNLKEKQKPIVEEFLKATETTGGGIISVPCGYGKTVIALYIACLLKVKTLVVVHKEFLLNQWKERIQEFIPKAKIGRIQSNKIFIEDYDIVIGMLQSISMKTYDPEIFSDFGLVIYDECHHLGAETFSKALLKTGAKYTLGLSATPTRADGLSKVFYYYLGEIVYLIKKRDDNDVDVKMICYENNDSNYGKEILNFKQKPNSAKMINEICDFYPRTETIIEFITKYNSEGRKILLLSDRRNHLKIIFESINKINKYTCGFYLGGMTENQLQETETKDVILGTFSMASEGFDCKYPLDTIILASPKSNIEQAVGRILRQEAKDRVFTPLVIDICDEFSLFAKQKIKRLNFYKKNKYNIEFFDKDDNKLDIKIPNYKKKKNKKNEKNENEELDFLSD